MGENGATAPTTGNSVRLSKAGLSGAIRPVECGCPSRDSVVHMPVSNLKPLEDAAASLPAGITYVAAAVHVADALTQDMLLAPIESSVIPLDGGSANG